MFWKLVSPNNGGGREQRPSYSEFVAKVEAGDVRAVTIYPSASSYELAGEYNRPPQTRFRLTILKEVAPDLTKLLDEKDVSFRTATTRTEDWTLILLNAAPLILLVVFCLFLMRQMQSGRMRIAKAGSPVARTGIGYDLHRLDYGRPLMVGGVEVPFDKGPVGHSDGDVLAHAVCDALLGASGLGDIGKLFPDTDPEWKGANSLLFLEHTRKLLSGKNFVIEYVDAVVILEKPKLGPHFPKMRDALARALSVSADQISLKAKTNEGMDAVGHGEAIAAHVVATLSQK
jgi:2-C-methyl-D-erythritol 2,4-cyclodiphosphate synthase